MINLNLKLTRVNKVTVTKGIKLRAFKHAEDKWREAEDAKKKAEEERLRAEQEAEKEKQEEDS